MSKFYFFVAVIIALAIAVLLWSTGAMAQTSDDTVVTVEVGKFVDLIASILVPVILAVYAWIMRFIPVQIAAVMKTARVDQLLEKAITYGVNTVAGAAKDKQLNVDVGSKVVANAVEYAINNGSATLIAWMGGPDAIRDKIIARLNLKPEAAIQ